MENQVWRFHSSLEAPKRLHIIDREYLDTARQTKRGLIFVSIHHHCLRLFCYWINQIDPTLQPYLVANEFAQRRRALHEFAMRACHTVFSGRFIPVNSDMRKTVRVLQQGGSILLLQDRIRPDAPLIPFLGYMVRNPLGAVRLAEMSDALIIPFITASRISFDKKKWSIHFWPHIDPRAGTTKARLIACLEQMVLNYPEVWQNWHSLKDKL
jgi:lauroyl/myristoyl acyltransferase